MKSNVTIKRLNEFGFIKSISPVIEGSKGRKLVTITFNVSALLPIRCYLEDTFTIGKKLNKKQLENAHISFKVIDGRSTYILLFDNIEESILTKFEILDAML